MANLNRYHEARPVGSVLFQRINMIDDGITSDHKVEYMIRCNLRVKLKSRSRVIECEGRARNRSFIDVLIWDIIVSMRVSHDNDAV